MFEDNHTETYHGVGPQNIEYEKTCSTANAMSVSPPRLLVIVSCEGSGVPEPGGGSVK